MGEVSGLLGNSGLLAICIPSVEGQGSLGNISIVVAG